MCVCVCVCVWLRLLAYQRKHIDTHTHTYAHIIQVLSKVSRLYKDILTSNDGKISVSAARQTTL